MFFRAGSPGPSSNNSTVNVLVGRIKLDPIPPTARGEIELMKDNSNPTWATDPAVPRFLEQPRKILKMPIQINGLYKVAALTYAVQK